MSHRDITEQKNSRMYLHIGLRCCLGDDTVSAIRPIPEPDHPHELTYQKGVKLGSPEATSKRDQAMKKLMDGSWLR